MNLIGLSINHKTASIELREALHLSGNEINEFIPVLKEQLFTDGFVISTCNRTEIFGFPKDDKIGGKNILDSLIKFKPVKNISENNFLSYFSCGAVKHIFSVASGIDSLIIGDSQIFGQTKEAFQIASNFNFAGPIMKRLFDSTVKLGKRVINETKIGEGAVSVSYAAVQVVEKIFANLNKKSALLIGAGETGELAAIHLRDKNIGSLAIANRTRSKAEVLAEKVNGNVIDFENLTKQLYEFDVIVSATAAEHHIISAKDIKETMKARKRNPVCLVDIAIPRDVDPSVKKIENVFYNDIDSLRIIVDQNIKLREKEVPEVEKIILQELISFFSWYNSLNVIPTIKSFRKFFEQIRDDEIEKIKHKIHKDDIPKFEEATKRLIGRLLHNPTVSLRKIAESDINQHDVTVRTLILKELFNLDDHSDNGKMDQ